MDPATRRRRLTAVFSAATVLPAAGALVFFLAPAPTMSREALTYSVTREAGGDTYASLPPCARRGDAWRCSVFAGSNWVDYRVELRGSRCWEGRIVRRMRFRPERIDGCVRVRDQVRLFDRLF